ncbi:MAG: DUF234 domain-containing protein [Thiovulaceae bacterium]|nr:DUF234 domain-containing protein [Sulfurimonadaceae bacterium]
MGWPVDTSKPLWEIIEEKLLANYRYIHGDITKITNSNKLHHSLLSALAVGDRREHAAFKKARVSRQEGEESIDFLVDSGVLKRESSLVKPTDKEEEVSDKLQFVQPFMRFWFASISPFYKGIKEGEFKEVKEKFTNREKGFSDIYYEFLVKEILKTQCKEDRIERIGSYWDKKVEIDILARTKSGKVIAGMCKVSNSKAKKSELSKLKSLCEQADIKADVFVLFSKSGFSNELKSEKSETLKLYTLKHLKPFIQELDEKDFLVHTGKRY